MALTGREKLGFHTLYFLAFASRIPEGVQWHWNVWARVGEIIGKAEAYACPGLPGECKVIGEFIVKHQEQPTISALEIGTLRDRIRDMVKQSAPREWQARAAGGWMGYSAGVCKLSLKDGKDHAVELRNCLRTCRENLNVVDPGLANQLGPIEAEAAKTNPPYGDILTKLEVFDKNI